MQASHCVSPKNLFTSKGKIEWALCKIFQCHMLTDGGEMVDSSTQTPRLDDDTKQKEEVEVEVEVDENNTGAKRDNTDQDHNEGN